MRVPRAECVGGKVHRDALLEQVERRLRDAHVRLDAAHDRLIAAVHGEALRARRGEDALLDRLLAVEADLGDGVAETFRILLGDDARELHDARATQQHGAILGDLAERRVAAERLLDVHDYERRAGTIELAHTATTEKARSL